MLAERSILVNPTFIGFEETSSYWLVQFFCFILVTILVVNFPERTKTDLITRLDHIVRAVHSSALASY